MVEIGQIVECRKIAGVECQHLPVTGDRLFIGKGAMVTAGKIVPAVSAVGRSLQQLFVGVDCCLVVTDFLLAERQIE